MKSIVNNFDTNANFWEVNKQIGLLSSFGYLKNKDTSKGKVTSSRLMWAIALYIDPDSKFINLPVKDRETVIREDYMKDKNFSFADYKEEIKMYESLFKTSAERQLSLWEKLMDEKTEYLMTLTYASHSEVIERLLASNSKLYLELERIKEQLDKDDNEKAITKGGAEKSASEKNEI